MNFKFVCLFFLAVSFGYLRREKLSRCSEALCGAMSALAGRYAGQVCGELDQSRFFVLQSCVLLRCLCASSK